MKNQKNVNLWSLGLMLVLLCLWSAPRLAGAGNVPPVPTNPLDAFNGTPDYYTTANWANSPPLAKFVDTLPGLGIGKANNLGQYLPVAVPDTTTYPGSDYYIIELREYYEKMHSDLNPTKLRGYVQVDSAGNDVAPIHYLGPIILADRDRPVRLKFTNKLPTGSAGDLFIPVDTSVMGAGSGPATAGGAACDNTVDPNPCALYTQNRANIHLHGGRTPWISDGTPHQWITPAGEITPFKKGVSLQNVPDMPDPGDGSSTYYFTNQQSARLMFYHDHTFGITRLNVYAGGAAGYVIKDKYEEDLIARGLIPPLLDQIPLIIQDKTYVDATPTAHPVSGVITPKVRITDPLWNWGSGVLDVNGVRQPETGDLWLPHVYMPAQTLAAGFGGVNPFGRWMYGPWFYPATNVEKGPVANPYYDADCSSSNPLILANCTTPGQPTMIPGTPNTSMGMEAFQDSVVVNGTAFPSLTVDPRVYRFRILNAASDRFWNLSFYEADSGQLSPDARLLAPGRSNKTEVKMLPASVTEGWPDLWPVDGRDGGVPDPAFRGPSFLQIGSEGGFLPKPVTIDPQPITYNTDPTAFWVGNVDKMGLALGPAERADVIVDFSQYAGKTLILYNDAPAAWPARVAGYDYYTGAPDQRESGGYGTDGTFDQASGTWIGGTGPKVGYAPNTRTVMQVIVRGAGSNVDGAYTFNKTALDAEFSPANPATPSLFAKAQEPIIVGQAAYKDAYPNSFFPINFPWDGVAHINDQSLHFVTLAGEDVIAPTEPKGIHDEMGASFDPIYGRMSGNLAMQLPNPTTLNALLILYGFSDLPTEIINNSTQVNVTVMPGTTDLADGTQIWKISHNGVDTHPIHFHIFDVQLVNRVGWDGQILLPEPNELGWKDTVKISPLEDTIVAVRPRAPALPFGIPNSLRPLNPAIPLDSAMSFNSVDWQTGQARTPAVTNILFDFGWEYVWHCHILSHEEMDMMRPIVLKVENIVPGEPTITNVSAGVVTWVDPTPITYTSYSTYGNSANEVGFNVYRSTDGTTFSKLNASNLPANSTSYTDVSPVIGAIYKVEAFNAKGATFSPAFRSLTVEVSTTNGPGFTAPATVDLAAAVASLPAGVTITQVAFYNGATLLGTDVTAPYSFSWTSVPKGTYSITARVTDSLGGVAVSPALSITVNGTITANFTATGSANNGADIGFCETVAFASTSTGTVTGYNWTINGTNFITSTANTTMPIGSNPVTLAVVNSATGEVDQITKNVLIVNHKPVANHGGPYTVTTGGNLTLNGSGTDADPCNVALSYAWNIDNKGNNDYFTANPTISYNVLNAVLGGGAHTISFQVTDSNGGITTATTTLTVIIAAPATITVPVNSTTGNYQIAWAASATSGVTYTLQESADPTFATGVSETLSAVSPVSIIGKPNGTYYYRVKTVAADASSSNWSVGTNGCATTITVITAPASGAFLAQGATATITVTAAPTGPAGSTVTKVDFFENGVLVGTDTTAPYSVTWSPATLGARNLTAITSYNDGATSTSASAAIPVTILPILPTITLDTPANGASYAMGEAITLQATPSAVSGASLTQVDFYDGLTLIKSFFTTPPYSFSYIPPATGVRNLIAKASYSNGLVATSATTVVTVASASLIINNGAVITNNPSVSLTISATGADKMSFSNDGNSYTVPENYTTVKTWSVNPGVGTRTVYVRFFDTVNNVVFEPISVHIILDMTVPVTTALPAPATFISSVNVNLSSNEPGSTIKYTVDGSNPTTSATAVTYNGPFTLTATTPIRYFATDTAGNAEVPQTGLYTITTSVIPVTVSINGGAAYTNVLNVNLSIAATGADRMSFSNNGISYSAQEAYATSKTWALSSGNGIKSVYVKLYDSVNNISYDPAVAQITLDTTAPVTIASPAPGTFIAQVNLALSANEPDSSIKYTLDNSDPATSVTATTYSTPIAITTTKTVKYFARDAAGNAEAVRSGTYTIHTADLNVVNFKINSGATITATANVTLSIEATDDMGVSFMRFSNDGVNYSVDEPYVTGNKNWTLSTGDGVKTVFIRFTDGAGLLYDPVTAQIVLDTVAPATTIAPSPASIYITAFNAALTANETGSIIKYTLDGSDPTSSGTAATYSAPINIAATTTVRYYAIDSAGNAEAIRLATYTIHDADLTVNTFTINSAATITRTADVILNISATDSMGVKFMRFSNDGVSYSADVPYVTGNKSWTLSTGNGVKTVFARFTDNADMLYDPVTTQIVLDTVAPSTSIAPAPGVFISALNAALTANESGSTIKYTLDGSDPATSATASAYDAPITISATATVKYFATDAAGNAEAVKSSSYTIHTGDLIVSTFTINSGAVATNATAATLTIAATDEFGVVKMRFSNDGITYSADETFAASKSWTLSSGDGIKTVYMRLTDGAGILYDPVTTQITLDTLAATTTTNPPSGVVSQTPFTVALTATDGYGAGASSIYYTIDGSSPLTSPTALVYNLPIPIETNTNPTIRFYAKDLAGNMEAVQSATFEVTHDVNDMNATVVINSGETVTITPAIVLHLSAIDATSGVAEKMQFSNDGINYSSIDPYSVTKPWTLTSGEGQKTVYVKFKETGANKWYGPYTAQITLAYKNGILPGATTGTTVQKKLASAQLALQIAMGFATATPLDLAHADVAPYTTGAPKPDGKIDLGDVSVLLQNLVGIIEL